MTAPRLYPGALADPSAAGFERLFLRNGWSGSWRNGVYAYHHYHTTTHEVLGCYAGRAIVRFGGTDGEDVALAAGDAVLIPAGLAHCRIDASADFAVVGAYPGGAQPDLRRGDGEAVDLPPAPDPVG